MAKLTWRHRLARIHPFVWIGVVAVVAGLVAWPLGGWDTVVLQSTKIPEVEPGTLVEGHQYSIEVDSAELTTVNPDGFSDPEPGYEFLILHAAVTNMTGKTDLSLNLGNEYSGSLTIDDGVVGWGTTMKGASGYLINPDIYLAADHTLLPDLQPLLPAPLFLAWQVPTGTWSVGDHITVGVIDRTSYEQPLLGGIGWHNPMIMATVEVTVEQGEVAPPPDPAEGAP